jgi:hypothetical protein
MEYTISVTLDPKAQTFNVIVKSPSGLNQSYDLDYENRHSYYELDERLQDITNAYPRQPIR